MNDAVGSKQVSLLRFGPVGGGFIIELQEKNRSMSGDVITIVILFVSPNTIRTDHLKGGVIAECREEIAEIDTRVSCRCICVQITFGFYGITVGNVSNWS